MKAPPLRRVVTADGSATLYSGRYAQPFASARGALSEAQHVFLAGSGIEARLAAGEQLRVLEVGFGTGLNFFVTAQACEAHPNARLDYTALEHTLPDAETVAQLGYGALLGAEVVGAYLEWRAGFDPAPGSCVFEWGRVRLELLLGDAAAQPLPARPVDAVYHDAFSPAVNPELWTEAFLARLVGTLAEGGVIASYCVQGAVRRRLGALGLEVHKRPGPPGGKREVLVARRLVAHRLVAHKRAATT